MKKNSSSLYIFIFFNKKYFLDLCILIVKMIICSEQTFIGTTKVSLLSSSSGTIIKRQPKALYIYRERFEGI